MKLIIILFIVSSLGGKKKCQQKKKKKTSRDAPTETFAASERKREATEKAWENFQEARRATLWQNPAEATQTVFEREQVEARHAALIRKLSLREKELKESLPEGQKVCQELLRDKKDAEENILK